MTVVYDLIYLLALAVGWPLLIWRRLRRGPGSLAIRQRLGNIPSRPVAAQCVWIHGVSLGEINATRTIIGALRRHAPTAAIVVSSTTTTGLARARELYPDLTVFRFPIDLSPAVRRAFDRVRPTILVLMELEVWPNLLEIASRRRVPVVIANGRITESRSVRAFSWPLLRWVARRMLRSLRWIGAQDAACAARFVQLGAIPERVEVVGSIKYDAADVRDCIPGQDALAAEMTIDPARPLLVCGSTGPGEEALLLDAYQRLLKDHPTLQLAIIPRKPERFDEVAELIVSRGFACLRRSGRPPHIRPGPEGPRPVYLGDTMGELRKFYGLATLAFVGRSLVPLGGSDVMEAAALAKPVLVGPHFENFAEPVERLRAAGGCRIVANWQELATAAGELLNSAKSRQEMGQAARQSVLCGRGATARTVERILAIAQME